MVFGVKVRVTGGVGSIKLPVDYNQNVSLICAMVPSPDASYDFSFEDRDGFGIFGSQGNVGNTTVEHAMHVDGTVGLCLHVFNASVDGDYVFRFY